MSLFLWRGHLCLPRPDSSGRLSALVLGLRHKRPLHEKGSPVFLAGMEIRGDFRSSESRRGKHECSRHVACRRAEMEPGLS